MLACWPLTAGVLSSTRGNSSLSTPPPSTLFSVSHILIGQLNNAPYVIHWDIVDSVLVWLPYGGDAGVVVRVPGETKQAMLPLKAGLPD